MSRDDSNERCFTFIWKLENASYCWLGHDDKIESPLFEVNEIHETNWKLELFLSVERNTIGFYSQRQQHPKRKENVELEWELAFLSPDGSVLQSVRNKNTISETGFYGERNFVARGEVFFARPSTFLPQDTLTARCRMWKTGGQMSKDVHCFARTRIAVEKRSFLWDIKNFSSIESNEENTYEIQSLQNGERLMRLKLFVTGGQICEKTVRVRVIPDFQNMKICAFQLSVENASQKSLKCFQDEFVDGDLCNSKDFTLLYTMAELMEKKSEYLPNDVLSLLCECAFSFGTMGNETGTTISGCFIAEKLEKADSTLDNKNVFPLAKSILINDFRSMVNNSILSDIKLKTNNETYYAHTSILGARSPVFKAMFSKDMREKVSNCVDIEDLNDDTVLRMLRYIYSADVDDLDWASTSHKYEILNLKDICSSYLKKNISPSNVCEALILADLHHDEELKGFVQDFILRHGKDIINSEKWKRLMETHLKLAAETMCLKFKE